MAATTRRSRRPRTRAGAPARRPGQPRGRRSARPEGDWAAEREEGRVCAVGRLAAGVAHELNNPLTTIYGCSHLALELLPRDHPAAAQLRSIERAADRCRRLLRGLLDFARLPEPSRVRFELLQPLAGALDLIEPLARYRSLELRTDLGDRPMPLWGDPAELQTAIVHLTAHLIESAAAGGELKALARPSVGWAEVQVAKEGGGAAPACRDEGLHAVGLALAHEIVRRHGGEVTPLGLSGFKLRLPLRR